MGHVRDSRFRQNGLCFLHDILGVFTDNRDFRILCSFSADIDLLGCECAMRIDGLFHIRNARVHLRQQRLCLNRERSNRVMDKIIDQRKHRIIRSFENIMV